MQQLDRHVKRSCFFSQLGFVACNFDLKLNFVGTTLALRSL